MSQISISTFLRPAVPSDIFDENGVGNIIEEKQVFYKTEGNNFYGPQRLYEPLVYINETYLEFNTALHYKKMFVIDPLEFKESIPVILPLKKVEAIDILHGNHLIKNTLYYLKSKTEVDGPFFINKNTTKQNLKNKGANKAFLVLRKPNIIKGLEPLQLKISS